MASVESLDFGTLLRRYRKATGLTQEELAERAGLSVRGISDLERGLKHRPHRDTVSLLANALQLTGQDRSEFEAAGRRLGPSESTESGTVSGGTTTSPAELATGLRTFLIADVRGYTRFTNERGDEAAARLAARFATLAREGVAARGGQVVELRGDEALAVFGSARNALHAALDLQARFAEATDTDPTLPLPVGIGLDAGESVPVEGGYRGGALNLAARLCSLAQPGEVLVSDGVIHLARKMEDLEVAERGLIQLKGFADPVRVLQVLSPALQSQLERQADQRELELGQDTVAQVQRQPEIHLPIGNFLGALPTARLVAREEELDRLGSALDSVEGGGGQLVLLAGETGIGKTRLAQEVSLLARDRGFLVATGRCYASCNAVAFCPFLDALTAAYAAAPSRIRDQAQQRWPYLARLLPDQLGQPSTSTAAGPEEQLRLFRAVAAFLLAIAQSMPIALMLDDLHWADQASIELLQHLARDTRASRLMLLGTYRDAEVGREHPLHAALRDLRRERLSEPLAVRRLTQEGTAALIAATFDTIAVSSEFSELIHRYTDGNPFFTLEVLQTLVERGDVFFSDGAWDRRALEDIEVPESVRSTIGERLSRLSGETQEVLHQASVLGQTFTFDDLQTVSGWAEEQIDHALEDARSARLIRESGQECYTFNHVLTQQTLYSEISSHGKRTLHLAAGEALERLAGGKRDRRAAEVAWHFMRGGIAERALPWLILAGDEAATVFAHAEAERHYRLALKLVCQGEDRIQEARVLEKLGAVLKSAGRFDEALDVVEQAADMYHAVGDLDGEGRAVAAIGWIHGDRGTPEEGIERIQPMLASLEQHGPSHGLAFLYHTQAFLSLVSIRPVDYLRAAERTVVLARAVDDTQLAVRGEVHQGYALLLLSEIEDAYRVFEGVLPAVEAIGNLDDQYKLALCLGELHELRGEFERSKMHWERMVELSEQMADPLARSYAFSNLSFLLVLLGDWALARRYAEQATAMTGSAGLSRVAFFPPLIRGLLDLYEGTWEEATRLLDECTLIAERSSNLHALQWGQEALAELDLLQGRPEAARARLEPLLNRSGLEAYATMFFLPTLAWAQLERGDSGEAQRIVERSLERASAQHQRFALVDILRIQGMVLVKQDRWQQATRVLDEALSLARSMPYPYQEARVLYEYGKMQAHKGELTEAHQRLSQALIIFRRLGARPYVEWTEQVIRELRRA